ncbi:MAG: hypothetical protein US81_C0001G0036 [Parcubacteria group bacterium GW2011_GWE2_38_18]|nr:MAG: hypothetical protein US81_C0001G0036 [Parcubacteria group bacterium GW2011_GWE2_38_18]
MNFSPELILSSRNLTKQDSKARTDEDFLLEAELRGTREPSMNGRMKPSFVNHDLLPHDVAEEWGIDKDEDPEGVVYKEMDFTNTRFVPGNEQNDIGEYVEEEGDFPEEEQDDLPLEVLKEISVQTHKIKSTPTNQLDGKFSGKKYINNNHRPFWNG